MDRDGLSAEETEVSLSFPTLILTNVLTVLQKTQQFLKIVNDLRQQISHDQEKTDAMSFRTAQKFMMVRIL